MKTIKINFHSEFPQDSRKHIISLLQKKFSVLIVDDYDYYFAMETIYYDFNNMKEVLLSNPNAIRIMGCGEAVYPDLNIFDYAIWHNDFYESKDRVIYEPLMYVLIGHLFDDFSELDNSKKNISSKNILNQKTHFCNFIYGNFNAHPMRDELFYALSKYKRVDSLGSHLKNTEIENTRSDANWQKIAIDLKRPYKFSIAAENATFPGYTSEKIMSSMMANTIPIYFGNPDVGKQFNKKSFIDANDFSNIEELVRYVAKVDSDDSLYCQIMSEPWRTEEQIKACDMAVKEFHERFYKIFSMPLGGGVSPSTRNLAGF